MMGLRGPIPSMADISHFGSLDTIVGDIRCTSLPRAHRLAETVSWAATSGTNLVVGGLILDERKGNG